MIMLTIPQAVAICKAHSIETFLAEGILMVLDVGYTMDGSDVSRWIPCPMRRSDLFAWLGY